MEGPIPQYEALYDFAAEEDGELTMERGQVYQLAPGEDGIYGNEDDEKDGWVLVQSLITGESGFVPLDYVKKVKASKSSIKSARSGLDSLAAGSLCSAGSSGVGAGVAGRSGGGPLSLQELAAPEVIDVAPPAASGARYTSVKEVGSKLETKAVSSLGNKDIYKAPIRRLSDPRLNAKLLHTMTGSSGTGGRSGAGISPLSSTAPVSRTPAAATSAPKMSLSMSMGSNAAGTPGNKLAMSSRAQAVKDRLDAANSPHNDRKLFSAAKDFDRRAKSYNPELVNSIRSEDYAAVFKKNTDAYTKVGKARTENFGMATKMTEALAKKIGERNKAAGEIDQSIDALTAALEKERQRLLEIMNNDEQ